MSTSRGARGAEFGTERRDPGPGIDDEQARRRTGPRRRAYGRRTPRIAGRTRRSSLGRPRTGPGARPRKGVTATPSRHCDYVVPRCMCASAHGPRATSRSDCANPIMRPPVPRARIRRSSTCGVPRSNRISASKGGWSMSADRDGDTITSPRPTRARRRRATRASALGPGRPVEGALDDDHVGPPHEAAHEVDGRDVAQREVAAARVDRGLEADPRHVRRRARARSAPAGSPPCTALSAPAWSDAMRPNRRLSCTLAAVHRRASS